MAIFFPQISFVSVEIMLFRLKNPKKSPPCPQENKIKTLLLTPFQSNQRFLKKKLDMKRNEC
jgi:hypothetical protein